MFHDLDRTLKNLLDDPAAPAELHNAEVSFETPKADYKAQQATASLFLFDVRENRKLRTPEPIVELNGDQFVRRMPPLRVDCSYLVTTWSSKSGEDKVAEEHQLLGQALAWLSRFGTIPASYLHGGLASQPFPLPTLAAQADGRQNTGEFWNALGIPPRPAFTLVVTVAMELELQTPEGPPVLEHIVLVEQINSGKEG